MIPLYKTLLSTAYKQNDILVDEINSADLLQNWLNSNGLQSVHSTEELVFNLQNVRHIMKKLINQIERNNMIDLGPLNKFSEKYKTNQLMQIGKSSTHFFNDIVQFNEPYHSILQSFKNEYKTLIK